MKVFTLTIHESTQPNWKPITTIKVLFLLEKKNNIFAPFSLYFVTGLTLRTETKDDHRKLKKPTSTLRPLALLYFIHRQNRENPSKSQP